MKNLAKFSLLLLTAFSLSFSANAQLTFGAKAGLNLANMNYSGDDETDTKILPTFHVGGILNYGISEMFAIETGLELQGKGFKLEEEFLGETFKSKFSPMYLQIPVMFQYQSNGLYVGAGPYLGFGIGGKLSAEVAGEKDSESLEFGNDEDSDVAPLDFGLQLGLGYMMSNGVRIGASYGLGLANAVPKDVRSDDESAKHSVIGVSVGYMFGGMGDK